MAKFKMECDVCGQPIEVSTGLFAKKYFTCECGYSTQAIQMTEEVCPNCRDDVTEEICRLHVRHANMFLIVRLGSMKLLRPRKKEELRELREVLS